MDDLLAFAWMALMWSVMVVEALSPFSAFSEKTCITEET
jgi:hypothetical protein